MLAAVCSGVIVAAAMQIVERHTPPVVAHSNTQESVVNEPEPEPPAPSPTPTPEPTPVPTASPKPAVRKPVQRPASSNANGGIRTSYDELFAKHFGSAAPTAKRIAQCESGLRANAVGYNTNGTRDSGLMQINSVHKAKVNGNIDALLDPETNLRVAATIYRAQGWGPWTCARKIGVI